jgi:hypothetical protein
MGNLQSQDCGFSFYEPDCFTTMMPRLRRTLVLKTSYELLAASHEFNQVRFIFLPEARQHKCATQRKLNY